MSNNSRVKLKKMPSTPFDFIGKLLGVTACQFGSVGHAFLRQQILGVCEHLIRNVDPQHFAAGANRLGNFHEAMARAEAYFQDAFTWFGRRAS